MKSEKSFVVESASGLQHSLGGNGGRGLLRRRKNGQGPFTLIELLVVIAIIIILVGLLLAALKAVWEKNDSAQVQNLLTTIETGIQNFKNVHGKYPAVRTTEYSFTSGSSRYITPDLYKSLCKTDEGGPYCQVPEAFVLSDPNSNPIRDGSNNVMPVFIDKWDKPIHYITADFYHSSPLDDKNKCYPFWFAAVATSTQAGGALSDSFDLTARIYYNFSTFQLRSFGKNRVDEGGRKDDIQNFAMKR